MSPASARGHAGEPRRERTTIALLLALFAVAYGTNVPSPLLLAYQPALGLSDTALTAIFGIYAAGLVPALFLAGPASDRLGRSPVATPFVVLSGLASLVFLPAAGDGLLGLSPTALLFVGRFLQGAVSGVVFSVGTAWVTDLSPRPARAARDATVALSAGFALGPLLSGLLGQWGPAPLTVPYLVHLALLGTGLLMLRGVPDTVTRRPQGPWLNLGVPAGAGRPFLLFAVPAGACVFSFPSLSITVVPLELQAQMPGIDVAVTGLVAGITMLSGVLVQGPAARIGQLRSAPAGPLAGSVGLVVAAVGSALELWPLLLPAAVLLGAGYGLALTAGLTATERLADPASRGALTSSFYAVAYAGFATPTLVSLAAPTGDFRPPMLVLAGLGVALAALLGGPGRRVVTQHVRISTGASL